jgi:hypothetical protein
MPLDARPLHESKKISLAILFLFRERKRTLLSRFALLQSSCLPVLVGA